MNIPPVAPANFTSASLYVGDLHPEVNETQLFEVFKQIGSIASIRVCRDAVTRRSLGYAYINYYNAMDAERALELLNYKEIRGRPCRIMWSQRDPNMRRSQQGNVFIKNLDRSIDNKMLFDTFATFGNILSCKVVLDENGNSLGYGFVHYDSQEAADAAVERVNGKLLNGKKCFVGPFVSRKERHNPSEEKWTNVFFKNFPADISEEKLRKVFSQFGNVTSLMMKLKDTVKENPKVYGFVNFELHEQAKKAVDALNNTDFEGTEVFVGRAQKKVEREKELRSMFEKIKRERMNKYQGVNLYVKNLDDSIDEDRLRKEFEHCGTITSCVIMRDERKQSKGFGFICFSTADEATKAVTEMNGKMLGSKPVYVALAERKEQRRAKLEAQHAQRTFNLARLPNVPPHAPLYSPGPIPYPAYVPAAGRGNFIQYPIMSNRGRAPFPGGRSGAPPPLGIPQGMPNNFIPVMNAGMPRGVARGRGGAPQIPKLAGIPGVPQIFPGIKYNTNVRNPQQPAITMNELQELSPMDRKQNIGEHLFPLITNALKSLNQEDLSGKITGMLLESMEPQELLELLGNNKELDKKIAEALEVLEQDKHQRE